MSEEQATEEGRLEFIRKKYFERTLNIPELAWYTDVTLPLDPSREGSHPWEQDEADEAEAQKAKMKGTFSSFSFAGLQDNPLRGGRKRVTVRRISVSSSEDDDVDIKEVLKGIVRDYEAQHSRSTRPAEA